MHSSRREGGAPTSSKRSGPMHSTDDEIREKYLERAIRELNQMSREILDCPYCPRGKLMPVLGSGHPQADVFMLKHSPLSSEKIVSADKKCIKIWDSQTGNHWAGVEPAVDLNHVEWVPGSGMLLTAN